MIESNYPLFHMPIETKDSPSNGQNSFTCKINKAPFFKLHIQKADVQQLHNKPPTLKSKLG